MDFREYYSLLELFRRHNSKFSIKSIILIIVSSDLSDIGWFWTNLESDEEGRRLVQILEDMGKCLKSCSNNNQECYENPHRT